MSSLYSSQHATCQNPPKIHSLPFKGSLMHPSPNLESTVRQAFLPGKQSQLLNMYN